MKGPGALRPVLERLGNARLLIFYTGGFACLLAALLITQRLALVALVWLLVVLLCTYVALLVRRMEGADFAYLFTGRDVDVDERQVRQAMTVAAGSAPEEGAPDVAADGLARMATLDAACAYRFSEAQRLMCAQLARVLSLHPANVRSNLWVADGGHAHLLPGYGHNMHHALEHGLRLAPGEGCVGEAMLHRRIVVGINDGGWGAQDIADPLEARLHPQLKWVVSWPLRVRGADGRHVDLALSFDGIENPRSRRQVARSLAGLAYWMPILQRLLEEGMDAPAAEATP